MELESDSRPPANRQNQPRFNLSHPLEIMLLAKMRIAAVKDKVKEFSYKVSGGNLGSLFDGTEKVLSWDSFHWYNRGIYTP
jgi:hypothetical protein